MGDQKTNEDLEKFKQDAEFWAWQAEIEKEEQRFSSDTGKDGAGEKKNSSSSVIGPQRGGRKFHEDWDQRELEEEEKARKQREAADAAAASAAIGPQQSIPAGGSVVNQPSGPNKNILCEFFMKTGACRHGQECSRMHWQPETSPILVFRNMYHSFALEKAALHLDLALEQDEREESAEFEEFFNDILSEFQKFGKVIQLKACCNAGQHLRGNVYVQYEKAEQAAEARKAFLGRWFDGHQLFPEYISIESWKTAICGLHPRRTCPKGKICNFLHVFRNPNNAFSEADRDWKFSNDGGGPGGGGRRRGSPPEPVDEPRRRPGGSSPPRRRSSRSPPRRRFRSRSRSPPTLGRKRPDSPPPQRRRSRSPPPSRGDHRGARRDR